MPKQKDDLSAVPANVLKQQEKADRILKAAQEAQDTPEPDNADPIQAADDGPVVEPQHDGDKPDPTPDPAIPNAIDSSGWEQKYRVLQGKYDAETKRLRDDVAELKLTLERQSKVIEGQASQQTAPNISNPDISDLDPEKYDGWGPEMVEMVNHVNRQNQIIKEQTEIISNLRSGSSSGEDAPELSNRVEALENQTRESKTEAYFRMLDDSIKGEWKQINTSPAFNKWLDEKDPITFIPRRVVLTKAAADLRGQQVVSIFNEFIRLHGKKRTVTVAEDLPSTEGSVNDAETNNRPTLTVNDVKKAEKDFIAGRITEDDYNKVANQFQTQTGRS